MKIASYPFQTINWSEVAREIHPGETGQAYWQVHTLDTIRIRRVEYTPGYKADHWCSKGHIIFCLEGEMSTELADGRVFVLKKNMSYFVGDENEAHRTQTETGCKLFIVD